MLSQAALQLSAVLLLTDACGSLSSRQKYAHVRQSQRDSKPYYTSAVWWCGVALMGIGELGNFAAYGFAPASLIAPLGSVSVIGECHLFPPHNDTGNVASPGNNWRQYYAKMDRLYMGGANSVLWIEKGSCSIEQILCRSKSLGNSFFFTCSIIKK